MEPNRKAGGPEPWILRAGSFKSRLFKHTPAPPPEVSAEYVLEAVDNPERASTRVLLHIRHGQLSRSDAPIIIGAIFGTVALGLLAFLLWWLFFQRREKTEDGERAMDLVSRPFPLSAKPRLRPIITALPPPLPIHNGVTPRRTRRKAAQTTSAPTLQSAPLHPKHKKKEGRRQRSSLSQSIFGLLPPISQGYGVGMGLVTTSREAADTARMSQKVPPLQP
ncbi:hypothetical protein B0H12DRAFT_470597 [Mycena haematopus]|nr:hypothetical protein B0H12DRAFT_470597 [Mycena haematopus]